MPTDDGSTPSPRSTGQESAGDKQARIDDMLSWAEGQVGVTEGSNRQVEYARELGYSASLPWCAIFLAYGLKRLNIPLPANPAYSGAWLSWPAGSQVSQGDLEPGDFVIYDWGDGGRTNHVALYIGGGQTIGGNESNMVRKQSARLSFAVGFARPPYSDASAPDGSMDGVSGGGGGGITAGDAERVGKAAAFSTYLNLPGIMDTLESMALRGERSLMNDQPLLPFIQQLCQASLRNFQSLPNGDFFAFYPDYFGGLGHRTAYWDVDDIEIIDGRIDLSDDALATHVYMVGDIAGFFDGVDYFDKAQSGGVVTIFNAFLADFMNPTASRAQIKASKKDRDADLTKLEKDPDYRALNTKDKAVAFLRKYGARPYYEAVPMVRNPFYEAFIAYQKFCLLWSRQFLSQFTLTFMPELFPGGIVRFPDHGIQMYVDEVNHTFDYATGFQTLVLFSAPASLPGAARQNVHGGMIRAGALRH